MLTSIITASLRYRWVVMLGLVALTAAGAHALRRLNIDAFPDTTPIQVQINTVATSLVPEEVERLITFPVELSLGGLPGLEQIRSISQFGLSQIVVTFRDGTDIYLARQLINERLQSVELPPGMPRPEMGPVSTGLGEVFHYTLRSADPTGPSLTELRTLQDWQTRPELRTVAGTAEINSWGGLKKQYQVLLSPEKLMKHDLTFQDITEALRTNNLNVGGGNITRGGDMLLVHGVGRTVNLTQLRQVVLTARNGVPIHLDDVAEITIGHELRRGAVTANGFGEVVLGLGFMRMGENSYAVTSDLSEKFAEVRGQFPESVVAEPVYNRTELVDQVIATVRKNLGEGALLVVAVLFIFLGDLRAGLIVASAIPLSLLFAFCGMAQAGIAGSLLSLGALDFGLVVDGSVVTIENVVRRLTHGARPYESREEIVRKACCEVAKPSLFGVLIIMIVYLPILALEGVEGKMFRPMALTVIFALAGSLVLSLTVIPVFANWFLPKKIVDTQPLIVRLVGRLYAPILHGAMARPMLVLSMTGIALTIAVAIATRLGGEFVPRLNEGAIVIGILRPPGTSLEQSIEINTRMEQALLAEYPDEIDHLWTRQGAPEVATDPGTIESGDLFISLKPRHHWTEATSQDELMARMAETIQAFPGQTTWFTQPIEMRINEMLSGVRADVAIKLFGPDLDTLITQGAKIEEVLKEVPGCSELTVEQIKGQPVLRIKIDQGQIARYGIPAQSVLDVVEAIGGKVVGEVVEDQLRFPLTIRLPEPLRQSPETIADLTFPSASGERVPLSRLASIEEVSGARVISREDGMRRITLQCNVRDRDLAGFVQEAQRKIAAAVVLPPGGYRIVWGGQFENFQRANARLQLVVPVAMLLIIGMLYLTFRNMFDALLVFTSVPFACIGGVLTLSLREMPFSISAAVGFIALSGISVLNSLVLVEFIRHLQHEGLGLRESIQEAGLTRLRPVLMTALVASLGFVPMAISTGMGAEVQRPLASVVIGGVITSTFMTLVVLPTLYAVAAESLMRWQPRSHAAVHVLHEPAPAVS